MAEIETHGATTNFTYWEAAGKDRYSNIKVLAGVLITGRIENKKIKTSDAQGNEVSADAMLRDLDQEVVVGSIIWVGLPEVYSSATNLFEIISFTSTPDIKGRYFRRTAALIRFKDELPTITA